MARAPRKNRSNGFQNYGKKDDRDYIAIVSKNKMVAIWTGEEDSSKYIMAPNDRDTRLGALQLLDEVLDRIPENSELLDKQVVIYALDCLYDCIFKPGDVVRSNTISDEVKEMIPAIIEKYTARNYNCFLMSERHSHATIVKAGFDWLQNISEKTIASANGVEYTDRPKASATEHKSPLQAQQDKLTAAYDELDEAYDNDDEEKAAKIESKIARLKARIAEMEAAQSVRAQA